MKEIGLKTSKMDREPYFMRMEILFGEIGRMAIKKGKEF
jgi:hypothetical protein